MKQELWLARDEDGWYGFFGGEPYKEQFTRSWGIDSSDVDALEIIRQDHFRTIFGCHPLRKGRKRKIKRILIELED